MELDGVPADLDDLASLALTNYGHFTSMRSDNRRVRGLPLHLDRLVHDCQEIFGADLDRRKVQDLACRAVRGDTGSGDTGSLVVRVTVFDPALTIGCLRARAQPRVLVSTRPAAAQPLPPLRVRSVEYRRDMPTVKHVGLFGTLRHHRDAQLSGFDDALFVGAGSVITEGSTWNIGFFDGDHVVWPEADCLSGVTMALLKQVHSRTITAPVRLAAVRDMGAAFATNATIGVRAISAIDNIRMADDHPIINRLRTEYLDIPGEHL
jgi:branched-subunit amino acid aminotransferase/4-amino-4-deoxychorismate lyase